MVRFERVNVYKDNTSHMTAYITRARIMRQHNGPLTHTTQLSTFSSALLHSSYDGGPALQQQQRGRVVRTWRRSCRWRTRRLLMLQSNDIIVYLC